MANKQSGAKFCVSIEQTKPSEDLKLLMNRLPWVFETNNRGTYKIFSKHLYKLFEPFGEIHERRIPRYIYRLSRRQMRIFFDACVSGDEHYTKDGVVQIYIGYEKFIDDLQEMAVYLGRQYLEPCLNLITCGDNSACKNTYVAMINALKWQYL